MTKWWLNQLVSICKYTITLPERQKVKDRCGESRDQFSELQAVDSVCEMFEYTWKINYLYNINCLLRNPVGAIHNVAVAFA
jgi:hypothetical protein